MIDFKLLRYKNFLTSGNTFIEIDFKAYKTNLIIGKNGAGKSTILEALFYALFGKAYRNVTIGQLINSVNKKNLVVEVEFDISGKSYLIRRGQKPNIFEIWENGKQLDQEAKKADLQSKLEDSILRVNSKTFSQIGILGTAGYTPFMQLEAKDRRKIIEDLLDLEVFSTMNILLKKKVDDNKSDLIKIKSDVSKCESEIEYHKTYLENIRNSNKNIITDHTEIIEKYQKEIEEHQKNIEELLIKIEDYENTIQDEEKIEKKLYMCNGLKSKTINSISLLNKEIGFFEKHDDCPTCQQPIDINFKTDILTKKKDDLLYHSDTKKEIEDRQTKIEDRLLEIKNTQKEINKLNSELNSINARIMATNRSIADLTKTIQKMNTTNSEVSKTDMEKLNELNVKYENLLASQKEIVENREMLEVAGVLLKDGGIKTKIIKQYIPLINKLLNQYLSAMNLFVQFELDENFNEKIRSNFRDDFTYSSFSEGEKARLDLAILFTWRAIAKIRNNNSSSILFMDEVFDGSLDLNGVDEIMKIINELFCDTNVFIISHKQDISEKYENVIKVNKVRGFSVITYENAQTQNS